MGKDFDVERKKREELDRTFTIGGETFTYRPAITPESLLDWNEAVTGETKMDERSWLVLFDKTIAAILEPGQEDKWAKIRSPEALHPLNIADVKEVLQWLITEAAGRPTGEPSGSSNGSTQTEIPSKEESSPPAAPSPVSV